MLKSGVWGRFFFILLLGYASGSQAAIYRVPEEYPSIAAAIVAASAGDTVLLVRGEWVQSEPIKITKSITVTSRFIFSNNPETIRETVISAGNDTLDEWFEVAALNSRVTGITFIGNEEHTLNITTSYAYVDHCRFFKGSDQVSISGGGGYVGHNYFEGAGDDGIDCDESISWVIEHNTIVNAHQDGIEIRLHDKPAPLTKHVFRYNQVINSGESGIQLIDYQGDSFREFYIHHNIFQDCRGAGVSCMYQEKDNTTEVYRGSLMQEIAYVYQNTFTGCNVGLTLSPGLVVLNNIFTGSITRAIEHGIYLDDSSDRSIIDHNLFYRNPVHFSGDVRVGPSNLMDRDPLLRGDFSLGENSPCIDAGVSDYHAAGRSLTIPGAAYLGAAPDLGAWEYGKPGIAVPSIPVINAGDDVMLIAPMNYATLTGTLINVREKTPLVYHWSVVSGPGMVKFSHPDSSITDAVFSKQGTYELLMSAEAAGVRLQDQLLVHFVNDYQDRTGTVGAGADLSMEAEDYRYRVGSASVVQDPAAPGQVLAIPPNPDLPSYAEYEISTISAGDLFVWVRLKASHEDGRMLTLTLNQQVREQAIQAPAGPVVNKYDWNRFVFDSIPEGIYTLRVGSKMAGISWDRIFITTDYLKTPLKAFIE